MSSLLRRPAVAAGTRSSGSLCVVRLASIHLAVIFKRSLQQLRKTLKLQRCFEILLDSSKHGGLVGTEKDVDKTTAEFWSLAMGRNPNQTLPPLCYGDLEGMPAILILVNKCAMGDTLPPSFRYFDIRSKYCKARISTATAFEQDCGRAFGYATDAATRPRLFVHTEALLFMRNMVAASSLHTLMKADETLKADAFLATGKGNAHRKLTQKHKEPVDLARRLTQQAASSAAAAASAEEVDGDDDDTEEEDDDTDSEDDDDVSVSATAEDERVQLKRVQKAHAYLRRFTVMEERMKYIDSDEGSAQLRTFHSERCVLISALPQVGKTGCYTYVLCKLMEAFQPSSGFSASSSVGSSGQLPAAGRELQFLRQVTRRLGDIIKGASGEAGVKNEFSQGTTFADFHALIGALPATQSLSRTVAARIQLQVSLAHAGQLQHQVVVVDAGCGLHGVVHGLRDMYRLLDPADVDDVPAVGFTRVIGVDLNDQILAQAEESGQSRAPGRVQFDGRVESMLKTVSELAPGSVDAIIYSLSLFEERIGQHVQSAHRALKAKGRLYIADWSSRFADTFKGDMATAGFTCKQDTSVEPFRLYEFAKRADLAADKIDAQSLKLMPHV